nr:hypothetical protein [Tanacetum cinerariifolium]
MSFRARARVNKRAYDVRSGIDLATGGFVDLSGSDFLVGGIRTVTSLDTDLQKVYVPQWSVTNRSLLDDGRVCREMVDEFAPPKFFASIRGMEHDQLFTKFSVGAARQMSLSAEVRMRTEYNIKEKRRLKYVVDDQTELLKVREKEIGDLRAQLLVKEAEVAEAIRLSAEASQFEVVEKSLRDEVQALTDRNATLEKEKGEFDVKAADLAASVKVREQEVADLDVMVTSVKLQNDNLVHKPETSSAGLQEKVTAYENCISQFEKFQDDRMKEMNDKFDKLDTDLVEMALHLEDRFYPHLLTTIFGPIGKAVEKGMQDGLSTGITHDAEARVLTDVAAYNPSAEADYLFALQHLQSVNFSVIAELKSNKDASIDTIMNLLRLEDSLANKLGLTELQPHVDQLMVLIHHSPDQRVIGASALSLSLDVSNTEGTSNSIPSTVDTTTDLSVTFAFACLIPPISTHDYEIVHAEGGESVGVDANPFPNVDDAELNTSY